MAALLKCSAIFGGTTIVESDPAVLELRDVIYVPFGDAASKAGIYDHGRKMVLQSWYFRGPDPLKDAGYLGTSYSYGSVRDIAPEDRYVYCGWLHDHFGHFLLSTLCRLWIPLFADPSIKVVYHSPDDVTKWFDKPWVASLFAAIGLTVDRFVRFERATRIPHLVLPAPSFEEENFAHRVYARFLNTLGSRIAAGRIALVPDPRPVFMSKERLTKGVQRLVNESEITSELDRHGVEVVFPEQLGFAEQIALWYNRQHVASFANSSLHTSVFAPGRNTMVISYGPALMSNYVLVDQANHAAARYLRISSDQIENRGPGDGFSANHVALRPQAIVDDLLRAFDVSQRGAASRADVPVWPRHGFWRPLDADPSEAGLVNLAIGRRARQSSVHPWTVAETGETTSGFLSGEFGFHTNREPEPWWEVELASEQTVHRVRLFNRADGSQERCARFSVTLHRADGTVSAEHRQVEPIRFGGLDGDPFTWILSHPEPAFRVRITLLDENYLHLDQVEILGPIAVAQGNRQKPRFGGGGGDDPSRA